MTTDSNKNVRFWAVTLRYGIPFVVMLVAIFAASQWFRPNASIRVSKSTTVITQPIGANGLPDYAAELRERQDADVPLSENGAVQFWKAMGAEGNDDPFWEVLFGYLEIAPEPSGLGVLYQELENDLSEWAIQQGAVPATEDFQWSPIYELQQIPWNDQECPPAAKFFAQHDKRLELLVASLQRPRFYSPSESELGLSDENGIDAHLPMAIGDAVSLLCMRAANRIARGELFDAWQDLFAAMKAVYLPRDNFVGYLITSAKMSRPRRLLSRLLVHQKVDPDLLKRIRNDINRLPTPQKLLQASVYAERLFSVGYVVDHSGDPALFDDSYVRGSELGALYDGAIDWNILLERLNDVFNEMKLAAFAKNYGQQENAVAVVRQIQVDHEEHIRGRISKVAGYLSMNKRSRLIADETSLRSCDAFFLVMERHQAWQAGNVMLQIQLELADFFLTQGRYPQVLSELAAVNPGVSYVDPFTGNSPVYRPLPDGYLLYCLGPNQVDDQGSSTMAFRGVSIADELDSENPKFIEALLRRIGEVDAIREDQVYDNLTSISADDIAVRATRRFETFSECVKRIIEIRNDSLSQELK